MVCDEKFTPLRRRHHCRNCGKGNLFYFVFILTSFKLKFIVVVCGNCSSKKIIIQRLNYTSPERVCNPCYQLLSSPAPTPIEKAKEQEVKKSPRKEPQKEIEKRRSEKRESEKRESEKRESEKRESEKRPKSSSFDERGMEEIYSGLRSLVFETPDLIQLENGKEAQEQIYLKVI